MTTLVPAVETKWEVQVDEIGQGQWDRLLEHFQDATINQTWSFGESLSGAENLSHVVVRRDGATAAIAQLRLVRAPLLGRGMAYLAWGPLWQAPGLDQRSALGQILKVLRAEYVERRRFYLEIKPHIWDDDPDRLELLQVFADSGFRQLPSFEKTFIRSLAPSVAEIRLELAQKWRNQLNYAEKHGVSTVAGTDAALVEQFIPIYRQMVSRKGYDNAVNIERFKAMMARLPAALQPLVVLAAQHGETMAGGIFSVLGRSGIYLLGATSDAGMQCKASYLVQWTAMEWMKTHGISLYDLGGVDRVKTPGTYHFKAGVCGKEPAERTRLGTFAACTSPLSYGLVKAGRMIRTFRGQ